MTASITKGVPGKGEWQIIHFAEGGYPMRLGDIGGRAGKSGMKPTRRVVAVQRSARSRGAAVAHFDAADGAHPDA